MTSYASTFARQSSLISRVLESLLLRMISRLAQMSDVMSEIMRGPKAGEGMEFELFSRFNAMVSPEPRVGGQVTCN